MIIDRSLATTNHHARHMRALSVCFLLGLVSSLDAIAAEGLAATNAAALDLKKFQLGPGLKAELFASEPLLHNPVAFSIDGRGRFFVAETHRWNHSVFDVTQNTPWLLDDLSFRAVNDRAAFLARMFATNLSALTTNAEIIRLVEDCDGDGRAETASVFADGFDGTTSGPAAGVLAQGTNVWFTCIPDLWRFTIHDFRFTNGPTGAASRPDQPLVNRQSNVVNRLATGLGVHISVSGHDVHGLIRGPDGRLYFSFGDRGVCVTNREGVVLNVPDTGGVLRCEPDGRNLEIFCTGLRNPQELAFDDFGNLWTVDNDTAGADPCRVLHLVEGGDYGWRMSYQHMKGFGPWVQEELWRGGLDGILPPAGPVSQGPAGLAYYPGTSATPQLAGKFVHADFPGGIWAYSVKPRGASYQIAGQEKILWNCWPTDVDFGPDGALYVLDWVQGWGPPGKGRIYRLTANDQSPMAKSQLETGRQTRRLLGEGVIERSEKELLARLGHEDRRVRLEAQWELAERGTNSLKGLTALANSGGNQLRRIHSLWGIRQIVRKLPLTEGGAELASLIPLLEDKDAEIRGQAALTLGEGELFNAEEPMAKLLFDPAPRVRLLAVQASTARWRGYLGSNGQRKPPRMHFSSFQKTAGPIVESVAKVIGVDRHDAAKAVGAVISGKFPARDLNQVLPMLGLDPFISEASVNLLVNTRRNSAFESHFKSAPSLESALVLLRTYRRTANAAIEDFFTNREPRVVLEAARAINDAPLADAYPALAAMLDDPRFRDVNWGWAALSNITPAGPFSANVRPPREQVLRRALNANFRLGGTTNAEALVRFARGVHPSPGAQTEELPGVSAQLDTPRAPNASVPGDGRTPAALRAEALFLLSAWEVLPANVGDLPIKPAKDPNHGSVPTVNPENWPGWFDRVVGLWRPLPPRPPDAARRALAPHIAVLLADDSTEVALAALDTAAKLQLTNAIPTLMGRLRDPATPPVVRRQISSALAALDAAELGEAVKLTLADPDLEVRAAALPHLDRLPGDDAPRILGGIVAATLGAPVSEPSHSQSQDGSRRSKDNVRLAQSALAALGGVESTEASAILRAALTNLVAGTLPADLELDALDAASRRNDPEIKSLLGRREAALPKDDPLAAWRPALAGGDSERGRKLFFEKVEAQCSRCHAIKGEGGTVGPALDSVARQRSREYLLESMVFPNRAIAPGFENVFLTLKSGAEHAGLVKTEDDKELRLDSPEEGPLRIAKADIVSRQRGLSAMPEGVQQLLTKRELRDLVEFLAGLR
jgi:quinoprotein glucose dehydrogenase